MRYEAVCAKFGEFGRQVFVRIDPGGESAK